MLLGISKQNSERSEFINRNCLTVKHENNYFLLGILLPDLVSSNPIAESIVLNKPKLRLKLINQFKYTTELAMSYRFEFGKTEDINIRLYHDAQVAEIVYCTDVQKFIRQMGPRICPKIHKQTRVSLNIFLNKWIKYLLGNGYSKKKWVLLS